VTTVVVAQSRLMPPGVRAILGGVAH
jgi:hypothetical protein